MVMLGQNTSTRNCSVLQITGKIINGISSSITPCKHTHCLVEYLSAVLIWEIISPCEVLPHSFTRWPARSSAKILLFQHWRKCQGEMLYATLCKVWAHYTVLMVSFSQVLHSSTTCFTNPTSSFSERHCQACFTPQHLQATLQKVLPSAKTQDLSKWN